MCCVWPKCEAIEGSVGGLSGQVRELLVSGPAILLQGEAEPSIPLSMHEACLPRLRVDLIDHK